LLATGIPRLDDVLKGGVPQGSSLVYFSYPEVEGGVFGIQTLYQNLKATGRGILVLTSSTPRAMFDHYKEFGWNFYAHMGDEFIVIDGYSPMVGLQSEGARSVEEPQSIETYTDMITQAMEELSEPSVVLIDTLSALMDMFGEDEATEAVVGWCEQAKKSKHVLVCNFTAWPYSDEILEDIKEQLFECTVMVGGIAERVVLGQYFGLLKASWTEVEKRAVLFKVIRPGGIRVYIPKVLVTGPYNSGKSTFVRTLSTDAVSVDRMGTTVVMDRGHIERGGFSVDIFGTPGQERFAPIIKRLGSEAMGAFFVVDATKPKDIIKAKEMLHTTKVYGLPYVLVANKQDLSGALSAEEIRRSFALPADVGVVETVAIDGTGVIEAFEKLLDRIMEGPHDY